MPFITGTVTVLFTPRIINTPLTVVIRPRCQLYHWWSRLRVASLPRTRREWPDRFTALLPEPQEALTTCCASEDSRATWCRYCQLFHHCFRQCTVCHVALHGQDRTITRTEPKNEIYEMDRLCSRATEHALNLHVFISEQHIIKFQYSLDFFYLQTFIYYTGCFM